MSSTPELIADLGLAIDKVLKDAGIPYTKTNVRVDENEIRILVQLGDDE
jgi:hypothetical protein